ncbi:MAG: integration host factor subunit beta [Bradymonadales bacterium]|nr:integration host factor subunit beta [Bradymonadales bacterium]
MTKSELIGELARRTGLSKKRAEEVVNCIFKNMSGALINGSRIEIRGFGSFSTKDYGSYKGRNPKTGSEVEVRAKRAIRFKAGKELRERVNHLPSPT